MECPDCGADLPGDKQFCLQCGHFRRQRPAFAGEAATAVTVRLDTFAQAQAAGSLPGAYAAGWIDRAFTGAVTTVCVWLFIVMTGRDLDRDSVVEVGRNLWIPTFAIRQLIAILFDGMVPFLTPGKLLVAMGTRNLPVQGSERLATLAVSAAIAVCLTVLPFIALVPFYGDINELGDRLAQAGMFGGVGAEE